MKELSIEQKAKRYDDAIERSKNYYSTTDSASDIKLIGLIFPELKESEDEKIRKEIIELVMQPTWKTEKEFHRRNELCVWLEKQGEQKPAEWSEEDEVLLKLSLENLTELKDRFGKEYGKVGDCIIWLESLRPQNTWKPSERQKEALLWCVIHLGGADKQTLGELLEELNKL